MSYKTDASRWRALTTRDPAANNTFVYTVKSTRIYCRPTCPARLARRANVGFCSTPAEAASQGFRPCKRCKPNITSTDPDPREKAVAKACEMIEEAVRKGSAEGGVEGLRLNDLARGVGLTGRYFHKIFKERRGVTPREWARGRMAAGREGEGNAPETRTPSLVVDSPLGGGLDALNLDAFDFNDLVNLDGEAGLGGNGHAAMASEPTMLSVSADEYGELFDASASMLTWDTFAPDYLDSGFRLDDKVSKWADAASIPDAAMVRTSTTFEQDAALILDMGCLPDLSDPLYVDTVR